MKKTLYIKNMVCDRCKNAVKALIDKHRGRLINLQLGRAIIITEKDFNVADFEKDLKANGFELMQNPELKLVESIKINLLNLIRSSDQTQNLSAYLTSQLHKDYSFLSRTFKRLEGETIEKYYIKLKIEKVKELIQMQNLSFSEIAYQLGYNSISHLSGQFKSHTGMTMSEYQKMQEWDRTAYDKIL